MFRLDDTLTVYLHRPAIDFRMGINGLAILVEQALGMNPFAAAVYVFSNRQRNRVKILVWERNGFWLLMKRLEQDRFIWPDEAVVPTLTVEQLHWLMALIWRSHSDTHSGSTSALREAGAAEMSNATAENICRKIPSTRNRLSDKQIEAGDGSHAHRRRICSLAKGAGPGQPDQRITRW